MFALPLLMLLQLALTTLVKFKIIAGISVTVMETLPEQPLGVATLQVYVPALKPVAVWVVWPLLQVYVAPAAAGIMLAVAVPSLPPGQLTCVIVAVY
jgi:hypothetical protein